MTTTRRGAVRGMRLAKWVVGATLIAGLGAVLLWPTIKATLKANEAFMGLLLRYSKWRYDWRDPADVGDGNNALQVIIESPMGIAEDASGAVYVSDRGASRLEDRTFGNGDRRCRNRKADGAERFACVPHARTRCGSRLA